MTHAAADVERVDQLIVNVPVAIEADDHVNRAENMRRAQTTLTFRIVLFKTTIKPAALHRKLKMLYP
ncbi:hypothetical protein pipiens_017797 [Culex pipiens pipiens]|uniref:Uncharacterized protein n=1 Tax=Culex pipiens pipiens TaxID=38569 RepID=A0ABD1CEZ5_CULPP